MTLVGSEADSSKVPDAGSQFGQYQGRCVLLLSFAGLLARKLPGGTPKVWPELDAG